jgi:hypothetical protein
MLKVNFEGSGKKWDCDKCGQPISGKATDHECKPQKVKGSQRKKLEVDSELRKLVFEFTEKLENDPYQPGVVHPEVYADDLQEVIEDLFWVRNFSEATLQVKRNPDGVSISIEVLDRRKINR